MTFKRIKIIGTVTYFDTEHSRRIMVPKGECEIREIDGFSYELRWKVNGVYKIAELSLEDFVQYEASNDLKFI
jgi:hypothetical protein